MLLLQLAETAPDYQGRFFIFGAYGVIAGKTNMRKSRKGVSAI